MLLYSAVSADLARDVSDTIAVLRELNIRPSASTARLVSTFEMAATLRSDALARETSVARLVETNVTDDVTKAVARLVLTMVAEAVLSAAVCCCRLMMVAACWSSVCWVEDEADSSVVTWLCSAWMVDACWVMVCCSDSGMSWLVAVPVELSSSSRALVEAWPVVH